MGDQGEGAPMTRTSRSWVLVLVLLAASPPALAQQAAPVQNRSWYPDGYRDLRIAADLMVADFPRRRSDMVMEYFEDPDTEVYELYDCDTLLDIKDNNDEEEWARWRLALRVSKFRRELERLGYPPEIYDRPLLEYERYELTGLEPRWGKPVRELFERFPDGLPAEYFAPEVSDEVIHDMQLYAHGMLAALKDEMEVRRSRLSPQSPRFDLRGDCPNPSRFEIRLDPEDGELWLIKAFDFRLCERRVADPWAHGACSWRRYVEGGDVYLNGHYMFEARWADGTVRRGPRVFEVDIYDEEGDGRLITFSR